MKTSKLRFIVLGDIHLGHPNTPTERIIRNLNAVLVDSAIFDDVDMIILEGDVFDRQLTFSDPNRFLITHWIYRLLKLCKTRNIVLRVLEGTPSHDWRQSQEFMVINEISGVNADVRYVTDLSIEYLPQWDINLLYIPDEWRVYCDETWVDVQTALQRAGLSKVDFCVMHGCFPHQMPKHLHKRLDMHQPERYKSIVNHAVFVGHIHQYSQDESIFAAGSFDRLCHGDETPKGYLDITIYADGTLEPKFIENTGAKIYRSINCRDLDSATAIAKIEKVLKRTPEDSAIRILANPLDPALGIVASMEINHTEFTWTTHVTTNKTVAVLDKPSELQVFKLSGINLRETLLERIALTHPALLETCSRLYDEVANG